jgi:NADH pyrophosphatase NudC (nudix superfamily)
MFEYYKPGCADTCTQLSGICGEELMTGRCGAYVNSNAPVADGWGLACPHCQHYLYPSQSPRLVPGQEACAHCGGEVRFH